MRDAAGPSPAAGCDLLLVIGDGLSSLAVERNAHALVTAIRAGLPAGWTLGPVVIAQQARVALADEAGALLGARLVAMLIGERPGLNSSIEGSGGYRAAYNLANLYKGLGLHEEAARYEQMTLELRDAMKLAA